MSLIVEKFLICDGGCGENFGVDDRSHWKSAKQLRESAARSDWTFKNGKDYCPICGWSGDADMSTGDKVTLDA
jgi:hypothetical protein